MVTDRTPWANRIDKDELWSDDALNRYTSEMVTNARENAERHEWANEKRDHAVRTADAYIRKHGGLEGLWSLVTGQEVPRSCSVSSEGSPITGETLVREHGGRGWIGRGYDEPPGVRAIEPWKLVDPTSGYVFPTNDYAAFLESGRDERGCFDPDRADSRYLVNEHYPEHGESWGVDDGSGWEAADGTNYTFVAYYNHFYVWFEIVFVLRALRNAHLFAGTQRHARNAAVLLDRVADVYPDLSISGYDPDGPFWFNSHGMSGQGNAVGCIWEHLLVTTFASTYDAISPALDGDDELLEFLGAKADEYDLGDKSSVDRIRDHVETNLVRCVLPDVRDAQIRGNFGMHQSALATSAVVVDEPDGYTSEALEFLFEPGEYVREDDGSPWGSHRVTGGDLLPTLVGAIDRDGQSFESPNYNAHQLRPLGTIARILDGYDGYDGPPLFGHPKFDRTYESFVRLTMCNRYTLHIGDGHGVGDPGFDIDLASILEAFERYGDEEYAQMAYLLNGNDVDGLTGSIFSRDADAIAERIERVIEREGPLDLPSENLAGFGLATLRDGEPSLEGDGTQRAFWLYYGRSGSEAGGSSHNHRDALNLGAHAHGLNLAPDLGYPERAVTDYPKHTWTKGTISHNTVTVDAESQRPHWVGTPRHFDDSGLVQVMDVEAPSVYPQTDTYRRTTLSVRIDDRNSYAVDCFRVRGGEDHRLSFHGPEGDVDSTGLDLVSRETGTYAGPDVPLPGRGERNEYAETVGNGFNYLDGVRRDLSPGGSFSVDWDAVDRWDVLERDDDVHLRLTAFGAFDEVTLADGEPPIKEGNPDRLTYAIARRSGADLESAFTSVVEPYANERLVASIDPCEIRGGDAGGLQALKIELTDGRVDYVMSALDRDDPHVIDDRIEFDGFAAVYREVDGTPEFAYVLDGSLHVDAGDESIEVEATPIRGEVVEFTRELTDENEIVLEVPDVHPGDLDDVAGSQVVVETAGERNGAYPVEAVRVDGNRFFLDVGDRTTVRGLRDRDDPSAGYEYVLEVGAPAVIPRSARWSRSA